MASEVPRFFTAEPEENIRTSGDGQGVGVGWLSKKERTEALFISMLQTDWHPVGMWVSPTGYTSLPKGKEFLQGGRVDRVPSLSLSFPIQSHTTCGFA